MATRGALAGTPEQGLPISPVFVQGCPLAPRVRAVVDFFAAAARASLPS